MDEYDHTARGGKDLDLIGCPTCGAPAEIVWVTVLGSTDGPVEHLDVRCVRKHGYFGPSAGFRDAA